MAKKLEGKVALVAGATRGAGRGIARMLGEEGAIVYCSGRSSRTQPNTSKHHYAGRPETIEETAELVDAAGGKGVAVRVDHTIDAEVAALFERIEREQGRLDVLVNILTGRSVSSWSGFTELPVEEGWDFISAWLRPHIVTSWYAARLMVKRKSGLLVEVIEQDSIDYHGQFFFDLMESGLKRLSYALAHDLAPHGITALSLSPGFMRTEAILQGYGVTEANWRDAVEHPDAKAYGWPGSETPCFTGRAVAALAADPSVLSKSGGVYPVRELAKEYGFVDIDGKLPDRAAWEDAYHKIMNQFSNVPRPRVKWRIE